MTKPWSTKHDRCRQCESTDHPHKVDGYCSVCDYQNNRPVRLARRRELDKQNKTRILKLRRKYYKANRDKIAAQKREAYKKNPEPTKARANAYYLASDPDKIIAANKEREKKDPERVKAYKTKYRSKRWKWKHRQVLFDFAGHQMVGIVMRVMAPGPTGVVKLHVIGKTGLMFGPIPVDQVTRMVDLPKTHPCSKQKPKPNQQTLSTTMN